MLDALIWNLLLTAGLVFLLAAFCRLPSIRRNPALRYWLWLLLLVKLVTPPLVDVPLLPAVASNDGPVAIAATSTQPTMHQEAAFERPFPAVYHDVSGVAPVLVDEGTGGDAAMITYEKLGGGVRTPYIVGLLAVSLLGTGILLIVNVVRAVKLYRWLKRAGLENTMLAEACAEVASSLGICDTVLSRVVNTRTTPLLLAWGRPLVVVPRQFIEDLSPQQLRGTVAHELAHLLRRDHWANLFVFIVKSLLWWNPVVWWAERELRVAQELCCDAIAINRSGANRRGYAVTLLKALDFVQNENILPQALASRMGSRRSLLRRFEMIAETQLSYQLSRWSLLLLLAIAIPLTCIPVRAEEEKSAVAEAAFDAKCEEATADTRTKKAIEAENKRAETAESNKPETAGKVDTSGIDPKIKKLGDNVRRRITTYSDVETLTLKDGQTGHMKVKKNVTPVAEILITPHFVENGTTFDLEGVDATGKAIEGTKANPGIIHNAQSERMGLGKTFSANGEDIFCKIQLTPKRIDDDSVVVEAKVLFTRLPTTEEINAMLMSSGKDGQLHLDFQKISPYIMQHKAATGHYPKTLKELKKPLPKDAYSPTGEGYHYEAQQSRFILSSCGKDGIYGNDDDEILITESSRGHGFTYSISSRSGQRHELYPLEKEKAEEDKGVNSQFETRYGKRPHGKCSISGKVISAETGKPIENARMYLFDNKTFGSIFIHTAADGTFEFKDIPTGPFSMQLSLSPGYQDVSYDPEDKGGQFPPFLLKTGEQRSGVVLKAKRAYQISGKITDENGNKPDNIKYLGVAAWFRIENGDEYRIKQGLVNRQDGSYLIDGLSGRPVYVTAKYRRTAKIDNPYPPIYYPGTFSRVEAKQIAFDEKQHVENIDITLRKGDVVVLEGTVTDRETKAPIPKTLVTVHHADMLFDRVAAYTDEKGVYQVRGLGPGHFAVHVDASPWGYVRTRKLVTLEDTQQTKHLDITVRPGVSIQGKFANQHGRDINIYNKAYGLAYIKGYPTPETNSWSGVGNQYATADAFYRERVTFNPDEGDYEEEYMIFPTEGSFVIPAMIPGDTIIRFHPKAPGQKVLKILYNGQDVLKSGIATKPGEKIKDVTIMIGK